MELLEILTEEIKGKEIFFQVIKTKSWVHLESVLKYKLKMQLYFSTERIQFRGFDAKFLTSLRLIFGVEDKLLYVYRDTF